MVDLALMHAPSIDAYRTLIQWANVFVFALLVPMVWFVRSCAPPDGAALVGEPYNGSVVGRDRRELAIAI